MKEKEISEFNLSLNRLSQKIKPFVKQIATFWQILQEKHCNIRGSHHKNQLLCFEAHQTTEFNHIPPFRYFAAKI